VHRLRIFEKRVLRKMFVLKKEEETQAGEIAYILGGGVINFTLRQTLLGRSNDGECDRRCVKQA
jgi:hypothetical protein